MNQPVFRFAPSPHDHLHLGHAYSAMLNAKMAAEMGGRFLLRIEDIDSTRCNPDFEKSIYDDLRWLGLEWETPVRRQSEHFSEYRNALTRLADMGLVYPAFLSRAQLHSRIKEAQSKGEVWPCDPDATPLYPIDERDMTEDQQLQMIATGIPYAWRINMDKALTTINKPLYWNETGVGPRGETGRITAEPEKWGDVIIARNDTPTSYHLSVVVDDALQGVTHIVRSHDLFYVTSIHRLLQELLELPVPLYHHHKLVREEDGAKLSETRRKLSLKELRAEGWTPEAIREELKI